jgi:hypothetical protein
MSQTRRIGTTVPICPPAPVSKLPPVTPNDSGDRPGLKPIGVILAEYLAEVQKRAAA